MAKLSANGTEVARYVRESTPDAVNIRSSRTYISVRSNGRVLRKHVAVIVDVFSPKGYRLSTAGWKRWQRFPKGVPDMEKLDRLYVDISGFRRLEGVNNG